MAWQTLDRRSPVIDENAAPILSEPLREKIRAFFPRYETRRAALLPALHLVQDALGHVSQQAMKEIADVLEIPPSQVLDTLTFYTHFWEHDKGKKVIVACRSLSCAIMGSERVLDELKSQLHIDEHGTTPDRAYSLLTEECLAACDHAPCLLINERLHKRVKPEDVPKILKDPKNAEIPYPRSDLFDNPASSHEASAVASPSRPAPAPMPADVVAQNPPPTPRQPEKSPPLPKTSDIQEMRES